MYAQKNTLPPPPPPKKKKKKKKIKPFPNLKINYQNIVQIKDCA